MFNWCCSGIIPAVPGSASWKHTTASAVVLLLCGWEQNDELLDLEGLMQHRQYLSTLHSCPKQRDCYVMQTLFLSPPQGEK